MELGVVMFGTHRVGVEPSRWKVETLSSVQFSTVIHESCLNYPTVALGGGNCNVGQGEAVGRRLQLAGHSSDTHLEHSSRPSVLLLQKVMKHFLLF